jgi:hypothetical protein
MGAAAIARPAVDARKLAWWAEEAHGKQGAPLYVVLDDDGNPKLTDERPANAKQLLFEVDTTGLRRPLVQPAQLTLELQSGRKFDLLHDPRSPGCDALFWTASAIEKFLFPYYHAQRLFSDERMATFRNEYRADRELVAVLHRAPSRARLIFTDTKEGEENWIELSDR